MRLRDTDGGEYSFQAHLAPIRNVAIDPDAVFEIRFGANLPDVAWSNTQALSLVVPVQHGQVSLRDFEWRRTALVFFLRKGARLLSFRLCDLQDGLVGTRCRRRRTYSSRSDHESGCNRRRSLHLSTFPFRLVRAARRTRPWLIEIFQVSRRRHPSIACVSLLQIV